MIASTEFAGSLPLFPPIPGHSLATSWSLPAIRQKQLLFNRLSSPGQIHVYSAECYAGERLRIQSFVPVLPMGGAVVPACAIIAQSLPYSADVTKLPFDLPTGYSAVVAPSPSALNVPIQDPLTKVRYYPGPLIDTRTLVSGRYYILVWSPHNQMGKYMLQIGTHWPWRWLYWLQLPRFWWQIRGWFGYSRQMAYVVSAGLLLLILLLWRVIRQQRQSKS